MTGDKPAPAGFDVDDSDDRPGEPLHPGENTIVDRGNHPLKRAGYIRVWCETWNDSDGKYTVSGKLQVIGDDGEGDIFAIPADQRARDASVIYRLRGDLREIESGHVAEVPNYDSEAGEYTITREVKRRGRANMELLEARRLDDSGSWYIHGNQGVDL